MKRYYYFGLVTALTFGVLSAQENLIPNGGLEIWVSETEPQNFAPFNIGTLYVNYHLQQESVIKKSGDFSAKHTSQDVTQTIGGELAPVIPGETYIISYWYLDNDDHARTRIWSNWRSGSTDLTDNEDVLKPDEYSVDNPEWQKVEFTLIAPPTATHFRLQARTYRQTVTQAGGDIYYDDFSVVKVENASVKDNQISGLKIYPNPVSGGQVEIYSDSNFLKEVSIYDVLGKKVLETAMQNNGYLNVGVLNSGVYIIKIIESGKTSTQKLIVK